MDNWVEQAKAAKFRARDLARGCGISVRQLERYFLQKHRKTPQQWLDELRQREALPMLQEGFSVKETADALGYQQPHNFCRAFKRFHGIPPSHAQLTELSRNEMSQNDRNVANG